MKEKENERKCFEDVPVARKGNKDEGDRPGSEAGSWGELEGRQSELNESVCVFDLPIGWTI